MAGTFGVPAQHLAMPGRLFDELASGGGSAEALHVLEQAERSRRLQLLQELATLLEGHPELSEPFASMKPAWDLLVTAAGRAPAATERLLTGPQVGNWIGHTLRRLHGSTSGPPLWMDAGHFHCIVLAACATARMDAELTVPVHNGTVALPALGNARFHPGPMSPGEPSEPLPATAPARLSQGLLTLTSGRSHICVDPLSSTDTPHWAAVRRLSLRPDTEPPTLPLDDLDPYRALDGLAAPERLAEDEVAAWQRLLAEAVALLRPGGDAPGQLRAEVVRCIVPWPGSPTTATGHPVNSASTGDAYASMIISRPPDSTMLADVLVHEFQHSKLSALLHMFPLLRDDRTVRHYAPWRSDPRHLTGLLHGAYAFVGVTGLWRERFTAKCTTEDTTGEAARDAAAFRFAVYRLQCRLVVHTLLGQQGATPIGVRLLRGLASTLDGWLREPVPAAPLARARAAAASHRVEWRLRNLRCGDTERAELLRGFRTGSVPVPGSRFAPDILAEPDSSSWVDHRFSLYQDPSTPSPPPGSAGSATATADRLLTSGDAVAAAQHYAEVLRLDPDHPGALSGWLLATALTHPRAHGLLRRPERFRSLLEATGSAPEQAHLLRLAEWLSGPETRPAAPGSSSSHQAAPPPP